ncbi:hypothetical protein BDZ97DRAFT_1836519 [Flammula alnicola]|nr:hypothetical protein BDZ97DRAFT_1836519 [Flammula alnicola]
MKNTQCTRLRRRQDLFKVSSFLYTASTTYRARGRCPARVAANPPRSSNSAYKNGDRTFFSTWFSLSSLFFRQPPTSKHRNILYYSTSSLFSQTVLLFVLVALFVILELCRWRRARKCRTPTVVKFNLPMA